MRKVKLILEFYVSDLTDDDRADIEEGHLEGDPELPRADDYTPEELEKAVYDFFDTLGVYDIQMASEIWGGTDLYFWFSMFKAESIAIYNVEDPNQG